MAAAATKDASCTVNTWEIFDEQTKGLDTGVVDDSVFAGSGAKQEHGNEETPVQRQARELAMVTLARWGARVNASRSRNPRILQVPKPPKPIDYIALEKARGGIPSVNATCLPTHVHGDHYP